MIKRIIPHVCIDVAVIFIVLWVIDRVNSAMHMLSRDIFKIPFFIFLLLVIAESILLIVYQRKDLPEEFPSDNKKSPGNGRKSGSHVR